VKGPGSGRELPSPTSAFKALPAPDHQSHIEDRDADGGPAAAHTQTLPSTPKKRRVVLGRSQESKNQDQQKFAPPGIPDFCRP